MKKIFMAAMTLVMAVFASCTNEDLKVENNDVKVNFTVAEKPDFGADSRAAKTGWADGDQIMVVFTTGGWYSSSYLTLTYNSGTWTTGEVPDALLNDTFDGYTDVSSTYQAYHYRGNVGFSDLNTENKYFANYAGGDFLMCTGNYTFKDNTITLTTPIALELFANASQVSVKGLDQSKTWTLSVYDVTETTGGKTYGINFNYFAKGKMTYNLVSGTAATTNRTGDNNNPANHQATGVKNSDGDVAFWVEVKNSDIVNQNDLAFEITDGSTTYMYCYDGDNSDETADFSGGQHYRLPEIKTENIATGTEWSESKWIQK